MIEKHTILHHAATIFRTGTLHRRKLTFCMLHGKYIGRSKSSLTGKRVKQSAQFKQTMQFAAKLGRASAIAAAVYRRLPEGWKLHSLYRKLTGVGNRLLKNDHYTNDELTDALWQYLYSLGFRNDIEYEAAPESTAVYQERGMKKVIKPARSRKADRIADCGQYQAQQFKLLLKTNTIINKQHIAQWVCTIEQHQENTS